MGGCFTTLALRWECAREVARVLQPALSASTSAMVAVHVVLCVVVENVADLGVVGALVFGGVVLVGARILQVGSWESETVPAASLAGCG